MATNNGSINKLAPAAPCDLEACEAVGCDIRTNKRYQGPRAQRVVACCLEHAEIALFGGALDFHLPGGNAHGWRVAGGGTGTGRDPEDVERELALADILPTSAVRERSRYNGDAWRVLEAREMAYSRNALTQQATAWAVSDANRMWAAMSRSPEMGGQL